jgi:hypothetical protein
MISSGTVATAVISIFEKQGWSVQHRFDYNPALIDRLGFGDRRYVKSDDAAPVRLPEPTLALLRGSTGIICEIDYRYTKAAFSALAVVRQVKKKRSYLERFFGGRVPTRLLCGLAMPDLGHHVQKAVTHLPEVDFLLVAGPKLQLACVKYPTPDAFKTFAKIRPRDAAGAKVQPV